MHSTADEPKVCVVMCGGRGTRIGNPEKYLLRIGDETIIGRIIRIISSIGLSVYLCTNDGSRIHNIYGDLSSHIITTSGNSYVSDMNECLKAVSITPLLLIPGDLVFRSPDTISMFMKEASMIGMDLINLASNGEITGITIFKKIPSVKPLIYSYVETDDEIINVNNIEDYNRALRMLGLNWFDPAD
jgi:GTP:adenosylcobinamide-phosphate guanylyltransferase